jgi:hypothetical protein
MVEICDGMVVMQNKYILIISKHRHRKHYKCFGAESFFIFLGRGLGCFGLPQPALKRYGVGV